MSFKIGDKVKCRSRKDLFCEFGEKREPYESHLGFRDVLLGQVGKIIKVEDHRGHECVLVQYSIYDLWGEKPSWWYYSDVLERVE